MNYCLPVGKTKNSLNKNNQEHVYNKEQKAAEQETSAEGLILKELPSYLKYAFLELEKGKPVIISAALTEIEEQKLLKILRKYKEAIAWSIEDIKCETPENSNFLKKGKIIILVKIRIFF